MTGNSEFNSTIQRGRQKNVASLELKNDKEHVNSEACVINIRSYNSSVQQMKNNFLLKIKDCISQAQYLFFKTCEDFDVYK